MAIGHDNDLIVHIYGSKGTIRWHQEDPNYIEVIYKDKPAMKLSRERDGLKALGESMVRIPGGHPKGYLEASANLYKAFIATLVRKGLRC